jgi:hypothetical protein
MPVTRPDALFTLAELPLLLQEPPVTVLESCSVAPAHMLADPAMVPALGEVFTVITRAAPITPQLLVMV